MSNIDSEYDVRSDKVSELKKKGIPPYRNDFKKTHFANEIEKYPETHKLRDAEEVLAGPKDEVAVAARVLAIREHGKVSFVDIRDMRGDAQLCVKEDIVGADNYKFFLDYIDIGDFVGATGEVFITKKDTTAVCVLNIVLLSKAVAPFPKEHFGIEDQELRYRKRYIDMVINKGSRQVIEKRTETIRALSDWFYERGFIELNTRVLQTHYGGANARPFKTHHHYLDIPLYLRISNELDLKMAVAGGFERAFEIAVDFRNEGIDAQHLQEFLMLEWYCAYENFEKGMEWTEDIVSEVAQKVVGRKEGIVYLKNSDEPTNISLDPPYKRIRFNDLLKEHLKEFDIDANSDKEKLISTANKLGIETAGKSRASLLDEIYKKEIRPKIIEPTFVTHHPAYLLPLASRSADNPDFVESYQLIVGGIELVKGYTELVDPVIQRETLKEQAKARSEGDEEAMIENEEFVTAMEHGFPPMTGWGMGIERFVAILTGVKNIKETVLFPLISPKNSDNK